MMCFSADIDCWEKDKGGQHEHVGRSQVTYDERGRPTTHFPDDMNDGGDADRGATGPSLPASDVVDGGG